MARPQKGNDASRFRDIRRRCRNKAPVGVIEDLLREISDPYYRSQSHILIAQLNGDPSRIERALSSADRVDALWRRAELFGELLKSSKDLAKELQEMVKRGIYHRVLELPNGKGLSDAISHCSRRFEAGMLPDLLMKALGNRGFESKDAKTVLKAWSRKLPSSISVLNMMEKHMDGIKDDDTRSQLFGYTHLQLERAKVKDMPKGPFEKALEASFELKGEKRLEAISYLTSAASSRWPIELVRKRSKKKTSLVERIKIISYLASASDKAGLKDLADELIEDAVALTGSLDNKDKRSGLRLHLAKNLLRMGRKDDALSQMNLIMDETEEGDPVRSFMVKALEKEEMEIPWKIEVQKNEGPKVPRKNMARDVLALYDTYEGAVKEIHVRAIARAAPLCYGFDLDLALIGFPEKDLDVLMERTSKETNIGKGGKYLKDLHSQGRVKLIPTVGKEPPKDWKDIGYPVATTSRPGKEKAMDLDGARKRSENGKVCLIMGLGKQGLPKDLLDSVPAHLELTGRKVPLETATAMGIIAYQLFLSRN